MKTIIRREFLDRVQSFQFTILLGLTVVLFAANGLIFVKSNAQKVDAFQKTTSMTGEGMSTMMTILARSPSPLLFIADGDDKDRPSAYTLWPGGTFWARTPNPRTFKLPAIPPLDWAFIIGTLFSLYTILLGYNAISGEREDGTLRLVLSNPVGRVRLLAAKYLSIFSSVAATLLAGALVSLLIIGILAPQILTLPNMSRIVLVLVSALAYVSVFSFLSLFFSALIPRSSLVLLALLGVWVLFAVVIPSSSAVLMEKLTGASREIQAARMQQPTIQKEIWARIEDIRMKAERGEFKTEEEIKAAADRAFEDGQAKLNRFYDNFDKNQRRKLEAARNLSRLSPAALFQYAAESLILSGIIGEDQFLRQARDYARVYDAYILKKLGKVVQTANFKFSTEIKFNGKAIDLNSPQPQEYRGDKSDFPVFSERRPSLEAGLKSALGDLAGLILWNIVLAVMAFAAFIRADVR